MNANATCELRRLRGLRWMALSLALLAGSGLVAGVTAAAGSESASLRLLGASTFVREVSLEASSVPGAAVVVLRQDGAGVATRTIDAHDADGLVRFDGVPVASEACTFIADYLSAGGEIVAQSVPVAVSASDFVPCAPILEGKNHSVVGDTAIVRGFKCSETGILVALVNGSPVATQVVQPARGGFAVPIAGIPYQESAIRVRAINAWGRTDSASYGVWNLGRVLARRTYIVVDKSECRLYFVKNDVFVKKYSVAVGTPRTPTPRGEFVITKKRRNIHPRLGGLGAYWLRLEKVTAHGLKFSGYFIHGTSWTRAIGLPGSLGCVDMLDSQILKFGPTVPIGTHVLIRE